MLEEANQSKMELISEHEIMQQAYAQADEVILSAQRQAEEIINKAVLEAETLKESSIAYVGDSLGNLQSLIGSTMDTVDSKVRGMMESLQKYYNIVNENRNELLSLGAEAEKEAASSEEKLDIPDLSNEGQNNSDFNLDLDD